MAGRKRKADVTRGSNSQNVVSDGMYFVYTVGFSSLTFFQIPLSRLLLSQQQRAQQLVAVEAKLMVAGLQILQTLLRRLHKKNLPLLRVPSHPVLSGGKSRKAVRFHRQPDFLQGSNLVQRHLC